MFLNHLIVCLVLPESRLTLLDNQLNERAADGQVISERQLKSADELATCLHDQFGLNTGDIDMADVFGRVSSASALA